MLIYVNGNILDAEEGIICQQVNCLGIYETGLAKQIKEKYPWTYQCYKQQIDIQKDKSENLGTYQMWLVQTEPRLWVCDLFGQYGYGTNQRQTNYYYLFQALEGVVRQSVKMHVKIYVPYKLGCGLAGGDWDVVESYLWDLSDVYNTNITIVKLEE